jgi:hypothetical protein
MSEPLYSIGTWDMDLQAYTPQNGVPAFNLTRGQLRESIKMLRSLKYKYTVHRFRDADGSHEDNDWSVLIERTDGKSEEQILKDWER